jgi:putative heme-binding domain-containing protein
MNCGVWRYHPTLPPLPPLAKGGKDDTPPLGKGGRRGGRFEVVAHGTTNPWGLDWDEHGELFITNCVIDHVWHVIPGGHYERMYGQDFNPHLYKLMPSIADHIHWGGGNWTTSRGGQGVHSEAGGGHAHAGCMIYLGDNWPKQYRGGLFTCNLHGSRVNHDLLERKGSSYVARHGKDFLFANDPWFRGLGIDYAPDGGVYISDWCDTGECHNYQVAHTSTGRIYKVVYGQPKVWRGDLGKLSNRELLRFQSEDNEWLARHARRILQERCVTSKLNAEEVRIVGIGQGQTTRRLLRALWTLYVTGNLGQQQLDSLAEFEVMAAYSELVPWMTRLGLDESRANSPSGASPVISLLDQHLLKAARGERRLMQKYVGTRQARLAIASGLQRLPRDFVSLFAKPLLQHADDATDPYLPLMLWYGVEGMPTYDLGGSLELLADARIPLVREYLARRIASLPSEEQGIESLLALTKRSEDVGVLQDVLRGLEHSLKGRRSHPMPRGWDEAYPKLAAGRSSEVRERATRLAVLFGDERALVSLQSLVADGKAPPEQRRAALQTLVARQQPKLVAMLQDLLDDPSMRAAAIQGLAAYDDPKTPRLIFGRFSKLTDAEKSDAIHTLSARPEYALALLDAVEKKIVPRQDLNAFMVRQLLALNHAKVTKRVNEVWGTLRSPSADKSAQLTKLKKQLDPAALKQANLGAGRLLYTKHCASCHKLFGEGGAIGPDLTGSQRTNLDYVLENMLDPSAIVPREYQVQTVVTSGGRTITGIVKEETERALTMQTQNEVIIVPRDEVETRAPSRLSMMPEGVIEQLTRDELRDLVAYLASGGPASKAQP